MCGVRKACAAFAMVVVLFGTIVRADEPALRETPLSPEAELATLRLADDRLTIELVAAEPEVDSPVAISFDADGRMYVAEMIDYPVGPPSGRIRLLEDRDNDGRYEHATVFAAGLPFPNGVLAARGGVFVTAAPDLLFLKDTNGDGVADKRQVVFTGFAEGNQQLRANGLTWGLDNWIYGANGRSDGVIRRPGEPADKGVSIRGRDFRFTLDGRKFEAISGQSQFGQAADDWGNRFISWNTIPVRHALFDQAFLERNPRLESFVIRDIADPTDPGQVFPISPRPKTFNRERTDYYNALCGLTIFRGDALGRDYVGSAFVGESLTNLVHRRALSADGATFISRRGEHDREFLAGEDPWFHPVYLTTGPDGALYVVDFYRRWVEHPAFVAESLRGGVDWRQGAGHGRIWKVSRRDLTWPPKPQPKLSSEPLPSLVKQLESPNGWRRDTAQRLLIERNDPKSVPLLRSLLADSRLPQGKLHAVAALDGLGHLDDGLLLRALEDGEPRVRQLGVRLAAPRLADSKPLREAVLSISDFPSTLLRFQSALALASIEGPEKVRALVKLADMESRDPVIPIAVVGSLGRSAGPFLAELLQTHPQWRLKPTEAQLQMLSLAGAAVAAGNDPEQVSQVLAIVKPPDQNRGPGELAVLTGLARGMADRGASLVDEVRKPSGSLRAHQAALDGAILAARKLVAEDAGKLAHHLAAVELLGLVDPDRGAVLLELLKPSEPQRLQSAAAAALAGVDAGTAKQLFERWQEFTIATRRAVIAAALRSPITVAALVQALEEQKILPRELDPTSRDALAAVREPALEPRIKKLLASEAAGRNRQEVVAHYTAALAREGNRQRGAAVFEKHCLGCHTVQSRGHRVGPDLSGIGSRPKETLLVDLFDPSRQVTPEFIGYTLVTEDGQVFSGMIAAETAQSITLRRAEGAQDAVPRAQIAELRATGKSLMPDGMEENLSEADVCDLLAFLAQPDARLFSAAK